MHERVYVATRLSRDYSTDNKEGYFLLITHALADDSFSFLKPLHDNIAKTLELWYCMRGFMLPHDSLVIIV